MSCFRQAEKRKQAAESGEDCHEPVEPSLICLSVIITFPRRRSYLQPDSAAK
jgi:hypothetical protein